jgi:hypothetical protein
MPSIDTITLADCAALIFAPDGRHFDHMAALAGTLRLLRGLRSTDEPRRKYAPIICVIPQGPRHKMVPQVEMGFDDVVFLSDPIEQVSKTLTDQLGHEVLYIDSPQYFGPDRRRLERVSRGDPRRVPGGTEHRRIQVLRDPQHGIQVSYVN